MGIPYYFTYLIQNYTDKIIKPLNYIDNVFYLFIDSNSIIYDSIDFENFTSTLTFETNLINNVIKKLESLINIIKPNKNKIIYIAFDGIPPMAKVIQQKNRRYKSAYISKLFNKNSQWDTCNITPGTKFMNSLDFAIENYFKNHKFSYNIILDLSKNPGEGEHKIFKYIRNIKDYNNNALIYGMDADLIMLSLIHTTYFKNIFLYRETPVFINSIDNSLDPNNNYIIDIFELGIIIFEKLTNEKFLISEYETPSWLTNAEIDISGNINKKSYKNIYHNKINDYIFICFLLGNDFLPHFPAINIRINGISILLDLYRELFNTNKNLTSNNSIIWSNFKKYIGKIAENENMFLKKIYNFRSKNSKKYYNNYNTEELFNIIPSQNRNIEIFINPYEEGWEYRYYYSLFDIDTDKNPDSISEIANNYLLTLQWTLIYYSDDCPNWNYYYKFHYPPLVTDLYNNIPYFESELNLQKNTNIIHPHLLLSYVLPKNSLQLLPDNIHNYLLKNYENLYREDYEILYPFCKYFWESHVKFPELDFEKFSKEINALIKS